MNRVILISFIIITFHCNANGKCFEVNGAFKIWNGWPPAIRLEDKVNKIVYAIPGEGESFPKELLLQLHKGISINGTYCLKLIGKEVKVPYLKSPVKLVSISKYELKK